MRAFENIQKNLGEISIKNISIDHKSRDEIPHILFGLQYIYSNEHLKKDVKKILQTLIPENVKSDFGRPGMHLWKILVLGCIRLGSNMDFDKLHNLANYHSQIREFLFHSEFDKSQYSLSCLKENIQLFTPEILNEISELVVKTGHDFIKKSTKKEVLLIEARSDSFVVETDVHYPTDTNLLFDAIRKIIEIMMDIPIEVGNSDWRQGRYLIKKFKRLLRQIESMRKGVRNAKGENKKKQEKKFKKLHKKYLKSSKQIVERAQKKSEDSFFLKISTIFQLENYIKHALRQIDQIERRVFQEEKIPHSEKVFSIFEPHTEWISKGKSGVPQELGVKVAIVEDQYKFILTHEVMEKLEDKELAIPITKKTLRKYNDLKSISFDKGFYTASNKKVLNEVVKILVMPKKGKPAKEEQKDEYKKLRNHHSAVESAINSLEHHGLNRVLDVGVDGFCRYVSLSILSRNIHTLGKLVRQQHIDQIKKVA